MELNVPTLRKPGKGIFKTNPESLRKWVENLPLVNIETSLGQLEFGLSEINGVELSPRDRFEVLELLTAPVMHVTGALQKKYLTKKFPLGKDDLNKSNQVIGLYLAMATGYKLLVAALQREANAGPQLAIPMQRAVRYLSESLIGSYQVYSQHREGIWADLHSLYALAEKHGLQSHQASDTTLQKPAPTTVENAYKQMLLLSLAGPYRLRQGEIRLVYNLLGRWAPYSRLDAPKGQDNIGFFTCHLAGDEPPCYLLLRRRDRLDENWRILNTSGMTGPAHATLAEIHDKPYLQNILPGETTLKRLMLSWGVMPERRSARTRQEAPIHLVLGINAIHRLLPEPDFYCDTATFRENRNSDGGATLRDPTLEQPTVIDVFHRAGSNSARRSSPQNYGTKASFNNPLRGAFALDPQTASTSRVEATPIESWKMVDISAGGYCLLWESDDVSSAQVGELVAIRSGADGGKNGWKLGVIRWMRFTPERGLGLGVELISSAATPVSACVCKDTRSPQHEAPGLLLPESKTHNAQRSLLLPCLPFRAGCLSTLVSGGKEERIILVRQMENTGSFAQFHIAAASAS